VLRLVREVGAAGAASGKPVGICGEAAADPLLAVVLVGLGATTLSMAPTALADVRATLLTHTLDDARRIAEAALAADGAATAREAATAAASSQKAAEQ
jgi:phosphotransferase system enzyme I (PtsI)